MFTYVRKKKKKSENPNLTMRMMKIHLSVND